MKRLQIFRVALASACAVAALALPAVSNAGSVLNGATQICTSVTGISMDPAGNLVINGCAAPATTGGTTPTAPSCTISPSATNISTGGSVTLTAVCSGTTPIAYSWTSNNA